MSGIYLCSVPNLSPLGTLARHRKHVDDIWKNEKLDFLGFWFFTDSMNIIV